LQYDFVKRKQAPSNSYFLNLPKIKNASVDWT